MKIAIVIPIHNEAAHIEQVLSALIGQTTQAAEVVLVNDQSTDNSLEIIEDKIKQYPHFKCISSNASANGHFPGPKVIQAFYQGLIAIQSDYDIICKFDGDILLPPNYLERLVELFQSNESVGMAGGLLYIKNKNGWTYETIASKHHLRGPIKSYRKACFKDIDGLKPVLGWDTIDVLMARYHSWTVVIDQKLRVKHLKPTGTAYDGNSRYNLGFALYNMRTGWLLAFLSISKLTVIRRQPNLFFNALWGYYKSCKSGKAHILTKEESRFMKKLRWKKLLNHFI